MRYREASRKLRKLGCYEVTRRGGGSHKKWVNPQVQQGTVLPDWGRRDLAIGTLRSAVRKLGLTWRDFQEA